MMQLKIQHFKNTRKSKENFMAKYFHTDAAINYHCQNNYWSMIQEHQKPRYGIEWKWFECVMLNPIC